MKKDKFYTVVFEYNGGTYIAQVLAESPRSALPNWLSNRLDEETANWGITRGELAAIIEAAEPIVMDGCRGVWCLSGSAKRGLALFNIIATDVSSR